MPNRRTTVDAAALLMGPATQCNLRIPDRLMAEALALAKPLGLDKSELIKLLLLAYVTGQVTISA